MSRERDRLNQLKRLRGIDVETTRNMQVATGRGGVMAAPAALREAGAVPRTPDVVPGQSPFVRLLYPPRVEKLPASLDFHAQDFAMAVPAVVGGTVTSAALAFRLPLDHVGWLQQFALYILSPLATTSLRWTVRINQGPVSGFDNIENPPGAANALVIFTNEMRVRVPNNALVDVLITNQDGAAITAGGVLAGWYHPRVDESRMYGED